MTLQPLPLTIVRRLGTVGPVVRNAEPNLITTTSGVDDPQLDPVAEGRVGLSARISSHTFRPRRRLSTRETPPLPC
jgi:hypothetical protein